MIIYDDSGLHGSVWNRCNVFNNLGGKGCSNVQNRWSIQVFLFSHVQRIINSLCMQDLLEKKRFTSQTPAAHCTYNYCPTKVREAIKVLSCRAQFNVCRESLRVHFLSALPRSSWNACGYKFIQTAAPGWAFSRKHILMNSQFISDQRFSYSAKQECIIFCRLQKWSTAELPPECVLTKINTLNADSVPSHKFFLNKCQTI